MNLTEAQAKVEEWLRETPLYANLTDNDDQSRANTIQAINAYNRTFDMHCVGCNGPSTFTPEAQNLLPDPDRIAARLREGLPNPLLSIEQFQINGICARDGRHVLRFIFLHQRGRSVQKIGQFPSLADLSIPETSQFVKVLGKDRVHELNKAIGLAAHGVGVGSYIYLRRVFESLVEDAHAQAQGDAGWDEAAYQRFRMAERVAMLKAHLPQFLVENPQLYGILSRHIHELSDDECLQTFDAMKEAILIIARDHLKAIEEKEQRERASKALQKIGSNMGGGAAP